MLENNAQVEKSIILVIYLVVRIRLSNFRRKIASMTGIFRTQIERKICMSKTMAE